ncbi:MAG: GGDEF domain-containing protein, partial [Clostridiales bacterium]|nr:GGDEF domain-containing protein [Clostridiales bacterium]
LEEGVIIGAIEIFTQDSPTVYDDDIIAHLSEVAMHDALTALPNRRYLSSFLEYRLSEFDRFDKPLAVLFADIDNFGQFNNDYGHDAGDAVLKNIALSLKKGARSNDLVGRWGGEEFLGIYSISQSDDAPIIGEKFRRLVESTEISHGGNSLGVTVSAGITVARPGDTAEAVVTRADTLMYESKKAGKNRVTADKEQKPRLS